MSPRAAWRLEAAGFHTVYDYVAGKADWLAADSQFEGDAQLVGRHTRRDVAVVQSADTADDASRRLDEVGFGPVLAVNEVGVLMGTPTRADTDQAAAGTPVRELWKFGTTTVRPSEDVVELLQRMRAGNVTRVVVTRSDGTLVGLFFADDVRVHPKRS